uniref:phosphohydrolase n=1 Tax=uncultured Dysgonomonas sp. TaxID=206096 RepID=UPI00345DC143
MGKDIYTKLLDYLSTFNPDMAREIEESNNEMFGKYDHIVEAAELLAIQIHTGQTDKAGVDYFSGHLTTVGGSGCTWKDKIVGYLHDAAEDTEYSVEQVSKMLQAKCNNEITELHLSEIRDALNLLNSQTAKTREEYISRIKNSRIATRVKLNDLTHNMDISRISEPTAKDMERLKRYKKEYRTILEYLGPVN